MAPAGPPQAAINLHNGQPLSHHWHLATGLWTPWTMVEWIIYQTENSGKFMQDQTGGS